MRKLVLLFILGLTGSICSAQSTLIVINNSGLMLDVGIRHAFYGGACTPIGLDFMEVTGVPDGAIAPFTIPAGRGVFRVGASLTGGVGDGLEEGSSPCWPGPICSSIGDFTFQWVAGSCEGESEAGIVIILP